MDKENAQDKIFFKTLTARLGLSENCASQMRWVEIKYDDLKKELDLFVGYAYKASRRLGDQRKVT